MGLAPAAGEQFLAVAFAGLGAGGFIAFGVAGRAGHAFDKER
jgi:hypothetical protein